MISGVNIVLEIYKMISGVNIVITIKTTLKIIIDCHGDSVNQGT